MNLKQKSQLLWRTLIENGISQVEHSPCFRVKGTTEPKQHYQKPGHGLFFCLHERSYFTECRNCRRTKSEGEANEQRFRDKIATK